MRMLIFNLRLGQWGTGALGTPLLHQRKNQYDTIIHIEDSEGVWKITAMELLEEQRVDPSNNTRN